MGSANAFSSMLGGAGAVLENIVPENGPHMPSCATDVGTSFARLKGPNLTHRFVASHFHSSPQLLDTHTHTHPEKLPAPIGASSEEVQKSPNSCPELVERCPGSRAFARIGRCSPQLARFRPTLASVRPNFVDVSQTLAICDE